MKTSNEERRPVKGRRSGTKSGTSGNLKSSGNSTLINAKNKHARPANNFGLTKAQVRKEKQRHKPKTALQKLYADHAKSGLSKKNCKTLLRVVPPDSEIGKVLRLSGFHKKVPDSCRMEYFGTDKKPTKHKRYKLLDEHIGSKGKIQKYAQEYGTDCHAHFSPLLPGGWLAALADKKRPLYIGEGEKKGDKGCKSGLAIVVVGGVFNVANKDGELIDELAALPLEDRDINIVFDSDAATNIHVMNARNRLARLLMQQGANVYWIALPSYAGEKQGLDDYLRVHGVVKFRKLPRVLLTAEDVLADAHRHLTDVGNANRFVEHIKDRWIYVPELGAWFYWDGAHWCCDKMRRLFQEAKAAVAKIYKEAALEKDDEKRKNIAKWAARSENEQRLNAMISLSRSDPSIVVPQDRLDCDPYLFGVLNGVLDLRTGKLIPAAQEQYITQQAPVTYDKSAEAPQWTEFVTKVCSGNRSQAAYIRRAIGYTLTGCTGEQVLFFLHGNGQNGKSVLIETISHILGDYSVAAPSSMLMKTHNEAIPNDVARLRGRRMASLSELDIGDRFNESKIKLYTGSDAVPARFLHQEWFEFVPTTKMWIHGNHKPVIRGQDKGIWRRIILLAFNYEIPDDERVLDFAKVHLYPEASGILNWVLKGCLEWQKKGLAAPPAITAQTAMYRDESDILGDFIAECCEVSRKFQATSTELYRAHKTFCDDRNERPMTSAMFGRLMGERFDRLGTKRPILYVGLRVLKKAARRASGSNRPATQTTQKSKFD